MRAVRRYGAVAATALAVLAVTACTAPDVVTPGTRPHQSGAPASQSPGGTPATAVRLTDLPGYTAPTPVGGGSFTRDRLDGAGKLTFERLDAANQLTGPDGRSVVFGDGASYTSVPGVLTFRGNNYRDAPVYGTTEVSAKKLEVVWTHDTGDVRAEGSYWAGAGWTGQPLLVNWPRQTKAAMGLEQSLVDDDDFVEVIYPVVDGNIYRMNLATGADVAAPIATGFAFKGTGSIDPRGYPLLYAGMGLDQNGDKTGPWRFRIIDLIQGKEVAGLDGSDPGAHREWGAFDSSALVNAASDTLIEPGENGLIYKVKLNSSFDPSARTVSVSPQVTKLRYTTPDSSRHGIESSAAAYRNLMFAGDNDGNIVCWDATTLEVVWVRATGDDTDATIVVQDTPDGPFLYTGNEVDKRGEAGASSAPTQLRKLNALTGEQVWSVEIEAQYNKAVNGGLMATPVLGSGEVSDLVFFTIAKTLSQGQGTLLALDTTTGTIAWRRDMPHFSWSSPVLLKGADGHSYGVVGDSSGLLHLFDPATGEDFSTLQLEKNIEASPAVYGNMLVVGTYAKKLYGIRIS